MKPAGYRFERLDDSRMGDMQYLYNEVFITNVKIDFLQKKYDTGFTGIKYVGYLAYDKKNQPAAYYGVFPLYAEYKNQTILAAQSGDTMTHSAHRGKGLFFSLATDAYKLAVNLGIKFVYGFPNMHNSYRGLMKMKWTHSGFIKKYKIYSVALPVSYLAKKWNPVNKVYNKFSDSVISGSLTHKKSFNSSINCNEYIAVKHDDEYFMYKNYSKKFIVELYGKCVYFKIDGPIIIGDIEKCSKDEFWLIIKELKKIAAKLCVPSILFSVSPGTEYDKFLSVRLKAAESLPICYLNLSGELDLKKLKFTAADFDTF